MEELRETSIHHTALKFSEDIKQMKVYGNLFKTVQVSAFVQRPAAVRQSARHFLTLSTSVYRSWRVHPRCAKMEI